VLATGAAIAGSFAAKRLHAAELVDVIAAVKPSVLPLGVYNPTDSPRFSFRGTCFVVGDGSLLATNFHVLPPAAEADSGPTLMAMVSRSGNEGQFRRARVVTTDRPHDIALLRLEGPPLPALILDDGAQVREGQAIAVLGFPVAGALGFAPVTHHGIVSSITTAALPAPTAQQLDPRAVARLREGNFEIYQLDATAYPGNSGGPVIDPATGHVLALLNGVFIKGSRESALTNPTGISYAIPVRWLRELMRIQ
jgi:S1-C subfamily serine protease